ncbi:MAG: GTP pyrophosphokinase family protein [Firmicutes bacterium]|nr:GTP pyrophosphokinase family protein [Bacillota bacterium]
MKPEEIPTDVNKIFGPMGQFREFMMMYSSAIKEVRTKFEILNDDLAVSYNRNPIEMIKSRIKTPESIINKMQRKNLEINMNSLMYYIEDVAGIRVICSFIDDIYEVANMLVSQDDITLVSVKDYIKHPKPNGYRSYHMIVEVPVFFANRRQNMKVEVQLRTIAMDFWASLEHDMKYKKEIEGASEIVAQLKECADGIAAIDAKMQAINYSISEFGK